MTAHEAAAGLVSEPMAIAPEWIDFNDHLNMAYYMVLFDRWLGDVFVGLGMGPDYARKGAMTTMAGDAHVAYLRDVMATDRVVCSFRIIDHSDKAIHSFQELRHADEGWLAATCETLTLHVDTSIPKVCPFPAPIAANVDAMARAHARLPLPEHLGRRVGIRRR